MTGMGSRCSGRMGGVADDAPRGTAPGGSDNPSPPPAGPGGQAPAEPGVVMAPSSRGFGGRMHRAASATARGTGHAVHATGRRIRRATSAEGAGESGLAKLIELHAISSALAQYILSLFATAALALSVDMLVPQFKGVQNQVQAFKLAIYSATPGWIAGVLFLLPQLRSIAGLVGLYGIYLFYVGVSKLMKVPQNNAVILTVIAFVITLVITGLASATIY